MELPSKNRQIGSAGIGTCTKTVAQFVPRNQLHGTNCATMIMQVPVIVKWLSHSCRKLVSKIFDDEEVSAKSVAELTVSATHGACVR